MSNVAVITARGGSKRIPRKNIKNFLGKPIMVYSIEAALKSGMFDEVMVSTDDEEIADIARKAGAVVPFMRSEQTANDYATTAEVLAEVLEQYEKIGRNFEYVCCIYPTAPFVTGEMLKSAMEQLIREQTDCAIPVVRFSFPPQRCVVKNEAGRLVPKWPECMKMRSQDLEPFYHDCGQFYCMKVSSFIQQRVVWMKEITPFIQNEMMVQDIDTEEDWNIAEMKYQILCQSTERE